MLLKRLEISGFKSFSRPTVLEFSTPVTAIVGPNGSGKSNVVEAMRFVLGEQRTRTLRGKRGEDLIFHGSKAQPRQNRASVTVVFDNAKRVFPVDYDEVVIRRVVFRDAVNQYFLNGSKVRLRDILELLAAVHIGASSHHIISQGETDRILSASSKDRRSMIEDALGLKIYHYKLTDTERKLAKTKENISQTETVRQEIRAHLNFLKKQVEKVRVAEQLRADLGALYKKYFRSEQHFLTEEKERLEKEKTIARRNREEADKIIAEKESLLEKYKKDEISRTSEEFNKKLDALREEKNEMLRSLGRLEGLIEREAASVQQTGSREEVTTIPLREFNAFRERIEHIILRFSGAAETSPGEAFSKIKTEFKTFWEKYGGRGAGTKKTDETQNTCLREKEELEQRIEKATQQERELRRTYDMARREFASERDSEQAAIKELLDARSRKNETETQIKILAYREERFRQEEARFRSELAEAGTLLGTSVLRYTDTSEESVQTRGEQDRRRRNIERIKIKIEEMTSGGNEILQEYEAVKERDEFLAKEVNDLINSSESLEKLIANLEEKVKIEFNEGLSRINGEFQEIFSSLFGGGRASLRSVINLPKKHVLPDGDEGELSGEENTKEEKEEGIEIDVSLPQKRASGLEVLSGGERSLTAISLVFALALVKPPPFLVLDETDAALDEANSRKYGELLQKLKHRTQFIIVTHNRETMTRAGVLYGVTAAADGTSRVLSVKLGEAEEIAE